MYAVNLPIQDFNKLLDMDPLSTAAHSGGVFYDHAHSSIGKYRVNTKCPPTSSNWSTEQEQHMIKTEPWEAEQGESLEKVQLNK